MSAKKLTVTTRRPPSAGGQSLPAKPVAQDKKPTQPAVESADIDEELNAEPAPVELVGEFLAAVMSGDYLRAKSLCHEVLECEPDNALVKEFMQVLRQKIDLDNESSEDESSSIDEGNESDGDDDESGDSDDDDDNDPEGMEIEQPDQHRPSGVTLRDAVGDVAEAMSKLS